MRFLLFPAVAFLLAPSVSQGALIAQYLFENDSTDSSGSAKTYNLAATGAAPGYQANISTNTSSAYVSDGDEANFLGINPGHGSSSQYTVSIWVYTTNPTQSDNRGIFSTASDSTTTYSWQIAIGDNGYEFKNTISSSTVKEERFGTPQNGVWENIVLQKFANDTGEIWLNGVKAKDLGYNPGGLAQFRTGINRGGNGSFDGAIDTIQIWDGENVSAATIYAAGVNPIPEPSALLLSALGLLPLLRRRR